MGFRINTNIAALSAHTSATMNNRSLDNSLSKLSSGLRINKAADDASGLAIANSLRAQASSLAQAVSNGNDAIGLIQTADGALNEYSNILDTIKTKAIQAASDGQNTNSRLAIQKDIDRLMEELDVIAKTTSFNGQKLLSGTFTNKEFQLGASSNESAKVSIASTETSQIGQTSRATMQVGTSAGGEVQLSIKSAITGKEVTLKTVDLQYNNDVQNGMGAIADEINRYSGDTGIKAKAIVEATAAGSVQAGVTGSDFSINGVNIGAINVTTNDNDGTLVNAINLKSVETGVKASMSTDGKLVLSSDGRAIKVEGSGDTANVLGENVKNLSTLGHIELVQTGSSEFQVRGNGAGATGADIILSAATTVTTVDSTMAAGSSIVAASILKEGSTVGGKLVTSAVATLNSDATMTVGSIISSGTTIKAGTEIGATVKTSASITTAAISSDMFVAAGSVLGTGTVLGIGTVVGEDFSVGANNYKKGDTLTSTVTLSNGLGLSENWTLNYNGATGNTTLAGNATFTAGTVFGTDLVASSTATVSEDMVLKAGSSLGSSTTFAAGSVLGANAEVQTTFTTTIDSDVKLGSTLVAGTTLKQGSTIGANIKVSGDTTLNADMTIKAGSILVTGSVLKAGTVLGDTLTASATGTVALAAGTTLTTDVTLLASHNVTNDFTMLKGTGTTLGMIAAGSTIAANTESSGGVELEDTEFTNLADIDVTTLEGAMKAIDTLEAAITNLDTIRSDLGSVQNQIVSTINNISVTQVNVKAAESSIRDVDFAAESANFSKFNILAQSGSYAMSQANAVQQNVLRLLQ